jgi:Flp pilus assembly protein TadB
MGALTPNIHSFLPSVVSLGLQLSQSKSSKATSASAPVKTGLSASEIAAADAKGAEEAKASAEELNRQEREKNLLRRDRGLGGTIQTGVRGVLAQSAQDAPKKTLLGQ